MLLLEEQQAPGNRVGDKPSEAQDTRQFHAIGQTHRTDPNLVPLDLQLRLALAFQGGVPAKGHRPRGSLQDERVRIAMTLQISQQRVPAQAGGKTGRGEQRRQFRREGGGRGPGGRPGHLHPILADIERRSPVAGVDHKLKASPSGDGHSLPAKGRRPAEQLCPQERSSPLLIHRQSKHLR